MKKTPRPGAWGASVADDVLAGVATRAAERDAREQMAGAIAAAFAAERVPWINTFATEVRGALSAAEEAVGMPLAQFSVADEPSAAVTVYAPRTGRSWCARLGHEADPSLRLDTTGGRVYTRFTVEDGVLVLDIAGVTHPAAAAAERLFAPFLKTLVQTAKAGA